jgi:hypothetical protein
MKNTTSPAIEGREADLAASRRRSQKQERKISEGVSCVSDNPRTSVLLKFMDVCVFHKTSVASKS